MCPFVRVRVQMTKQKPQSAGLQAQKQGPSQHRAACLHPRVAVLVVVRVVIVCRRRETDNLR